MRLAAGRMVRRLFDGPRNAGAFTMAWDGLDEKGGVARTGVYFYRLETVDLAGAATRSTRVALIR